MELIYLYFLPVTVALAWILVFFVTGRHRRFNDRILMAFLAVGGSILFITQRMILNGACDYLYIAFHALALSLELSICPLLFLYIRSVAKDAKWHNRYLWLFAPAVLFGGAYLWLSIAVGWDRILEMRDYGFAPFTPSEDNTWGRLLLLIGCDIYYITIEVMSLVLTVISIYNLVKYQRNSKDYFANLEDSLSDKMRNVLVHAIILVVSMFLLSCLVPDINTDNNKGLLLFRALWFSAMMWLIASNAYKVILTEKQLEVLEVIETRGQENQEARTPEAKGDEDPETDDLTGREILAWQQQPDKPYCQEGITLVDLSEQIHVSPRAISTYLNKNKGMNFNHWINALRIEEAKRLLRTYPENKIGYISTLCGYSTQSAFTRAFRQIVGQSPQSYRDDVRG